MPSYILETRNYFMIWHNTISKWAVLRENLQLNMMWNGERVGGVAEILELNIKAALSFLSRFFQKFLG
jgi:hypothetical protein